MKTTITIAVLIAMLSLNAQTNSCNCCTEKNSEFDFWLGSWSVTGPKGKQVGTNTIDKIQGNCVLRENWTSASPGYTGTSYNFYNSKIDQWEQIWVDNQGGVLHLKGNRKGNQMILQSDELQNDKGEPYFHRITWTLNDDGSVRQYWETITKDKDTVVAFDGLYKKS